MNPKITIKIIPEFSDKMITFSLSKVSIYIILILISALVLCASFLYSNYKIAALSKQTINIIKDMHEKEGKTIVMVTHDSHLARFADRVAHLKDGIIIKQ